MADRGAKVRNGFTVRVIILSIAMFFIYQLLVYFFGTQPPTDQAAIGDFADRRIDRFYNPGDADPFPGTERPPLPESQGFQE